MQSLYQLYLTSCEGIILLFLPPNILKKWIVKNYQISSTFSIML